MNWHRILELTLFDLRCSIFRRKGLMYILPFSLFWYLVLNRFYEGAANWIQSSDFLMLAGTKFDLDVITHLFVELPPSMSAFFILAIYTTPFFTMLAANDLFATDLGSGFFRFIISRCHRVEIFLARYLSSFLIIAICTIIAAVAAALIATFIEDYPIAITIGYLLKIISILILYSMPFIAGMAIISSMLNSAITAILLAAVGYVILLLGLYIAEAAFDEPALFFYLIPSGIKKDLISMDAASMYMALVSIPAYTLIYAWMAWTVFRRRTL